MRRYLLLASIAACRSKTVAPEEHAPAPVPTVTAPKATAAGTTDAGATGVRATDAATGFCVIPDQREINRPVVFIADDAMATVCFERGTHRYCGTVDLASGTWRTASEPRMPAPAFTTRISNDKRLFCRAGAACIPLELPVNDFDHRLVLSASGATIAAWAPAASAERYILLDAKRGVVTKELDVPGDCHGGPQFAGETLIVRTQDCSGIGRKAHLFKTDGTALGTIADVDDVAPALVGGTRYALRAFSTHGYVVFDNTTGTLVEQHPLDEIKPEVESYIEIDLAHAAIPMTVVTPRKKLAILGRWIRIVDLATGAVEKVIRFPLCQDRP